MLKSPWANSAFSKPLLTIELSHLALLHRPKWLLGRIKASANVFVGWLNLSERRWVNLSERHRHLRITYLSQLLEPTNCHAVGRSMVRVGVGIPGHW